MLEHSDRDRRNVLTRTSFEQLRNFNRHSGEKSIYRLVYGRSCISNSRRPMTFSVIRVMQYPETRRLLIFAILHMTASQLTILMDYNPKN